MNRILWNRRPTDTFDTGDIDEIVLTNVNVHIEQMDTNSWWIQCDMPDGTYWAGNFIGAHSFGEQENAGINWDTDTSHEERI